MALSPRRQYVVMTQSQIYYCDTRNRSGCVENSDDGSWFPNLDEERQFSGSRNKQYVLLYAYQMRSGIFSRSFHIFQLVPKSKNPRGYVVYSLDVGDYYGEVPDSCEDLPDDVDEAIRIESVDIRGEGTRNVTLVFTERVTTCSTRVTTSRTVTCALDDGLFTRNSPKSLR
jgi:hypothetical protein